MKQLASHLYQLSLGAVNVFLIEDRGFTLIDTGFSHSASKIFSAMREAGKDPNRINRIILTHSHPDHAGGAAGIKQLLDVPVFCHRNDAELMEQGLAGRLPMQLSPGVLNWMAYQLVIRRASNSIPAVKVDEFLDDGDILPIGGGLEVIHTPGHSEGHISLLLRNQGILLAGDICSNFVSPALSTVYEDRALGIRSLRRVAQYDFDMAAFGHGKVLSQDANKRLQEKFGPPVRFDALV